MRKHQVHLMDLVREYDAKGATWHYIEDPDHVTRGVMCWCVVLHNAKVGSNRFDRVASHTVKLANSCGLVADEYIAYQVLRRLEQA